MVRTYKTLSRNLSGVTITNNNNSYGYNYLGYMQTIPNYNFVYGTDFGASVSPNVYQSVSTLFKAVLYVYLSNQLYGNDTLNFCPTYPNYTI